MRYEEYQKKVERVAAFLRKLIFHRVKIFIALSAVAVITAALLGAKGWVISSHIATRAVYGDEPAHSANAFLASVDFEYADGDGEWIARMPKHPGKYKVRAVSYGLFGGARYGEESEMELLPRSADISPLGDKITYGEPILPQAELAKGDRIEFIDWKVGRFIADGLADDSYLSASVGEGGIRAVISPIEESIKIISADGEDVTSSYIPVLSEKSMEIIRKKLEITVSDRSKEYDGIVFSYDGYGISGGALADGDSLTAVFDASILEAGELTNTPLLTVINSEGRDVTLCYDITVISGKLTVSPRPLVITTDGGVFRYDGTPHSCKTYTLSKETPLLEGDSLSLAISASRTDAGEETNTMSFNVIDAAGRYVTAGYSFFLIPGIIEVTPLPITVTTGSGSFIYDGKPHVVPEIEVFYPEGGEIAGHSILVGSSDFCDVGVHENYVDLSIRDQIFNDVTSNYKITCVPGEIRIDKRAVTIVPADDSFIYDGESHACHSFYSVSELGLAEGHELSVIRASEITEVGSADNEFFEVEILALSLPVYAETGNSLGEVSYVPVDMNNYDLTILKGRLEVTPRPITVMPEYVFKEYDGTPISASEIKLFKGSLLDGHYIVGETQGEYTYAGMGVSTVSYAKVISLDGDTDVSKNYDITLNTGVVDILPRKITLVPVNKSKVYDGSPLLPSEYEIRSATTLASGDVIDTLEFQGSRTGAGTGYSAVKKGVVILNREGVDVSSCYDIQRDYGLLTVKPRTVSIVPKDNSKEYDGTPLFAVDWEYTYDTPYRLADGHRAEVTYSGSMTGSISGNGAEKISKIDTFSVFDRQGNDVTANYEVEKNEGYLNVTHRKVTLAVRDFERQYDGNNEFYVEAYAVEGELAEGQKAFARISLESANVGSYSERVTTYIIYRSDGEATTYYYDVEKSRASVSVKITPRHITLKPVDLKKIYDGTPLVPQEVECTQSSIDFLVGGESVMAQIVGSQIYVGSSASQIVHGSVKIFRAFKGELTDLTGNYIIDYALGTVTVDTSVPSFEGGVFDLSGALTEEGFGIGSNYPICLGINSEASGPVYLKLKSFGNLTSSNNYPASGSYWTSAPVYSGRINELYGGDYLVAGAFASFAPSYKLELQAYGGQYALPAYMRYDIYSNHDIQSSDVMYSGDTDFIYSVYYSPNSKMNVYYQTGELAEYEKEYRQFVHDNYLDIDATTYAFMRKLIHTQGLEKENIREKVLAVVEYMREAAVYEIYYDTDLDSSMNIAVDFLETYKAGTSRHFATSATMLYRAMGIPARYTVGFLADAEAGKWVDVKGHNAYAWVEVYVDGMGWMTVDVSPYNYMIGDTDREVISITPSYQYKKYDGKWMYASDSIDGNLLLNKLIEEGYTYQVSVSGQQRGVGKGESVIDDFVLFSPDGEDVTHLYDMVYKTGTLEVIRDSVTPIEVQLSQIQQYYRGSNTPLTFGENDYRVLTPLPDGYILELSLDIKLWNVGEITFAELNRDTSMYSDFRVYDSEGHNVTHSFKLVFVPYGNADYAASIIPAPLEITSASADMEYNGEPLTDDRFYITKGNPISGHTVKVKITGSATQVGTVFNTVSGVTVCDSNGNDVTGNYNISVVEGYLTVYDTVYESAKG